MHSVWTKRNLIAVALVLSFSSFDVIKNDLDDFEYELLSIARNFSENIMDEDECSRLKNQASSLLYKIKDYDNSELNNQEIIVLNNLMMQAKSLEKYIGCVGNCGNYQPSIEEFNAANRLLNAGAAYVSKDKYCVNIIKVTIANYVCFLAENTSESDYTVSYNWKVSTGMNSGNGTMGLFAKSVRQFYDNREKPQQSSINVYRISCKPL